MKRKIICILAAIFLMGFATMAFCGEEDVPIMWKCNRVEEGIKVSC